MSKFLVVLTDLAMGGITTAATNMCNKLHDAGHEVDLLVMRDDRTDAGQNFRDGIGRVELKGVYRLWQLDPQTLRKEKNPVRWAVFAVLGTIKKIINRKSGWIRLVFGKRTIFSGYDCAIAYRQCAPCYHMVTRCVDAKKKIGFVHGDLYFMGDISSWQRYMHEFDAVAYVSDGVKDGFVRAYPQLQENCCTVYNMFDSQSIKERAEQDCNPEWPENTVKIVTVSRLENVTKAIHRIPVVCDRLKKQYGECFVWYVIGNGPSYEYCAQKVKELGLEKQLYFLGQRENPYSYMKQADICVLPSFTEAFPMTVCESLILGVPVVVARYPAAQEQICDGYNGIVAEQSEDSIAEKIGLLLEQPQLLEQMKKNLAHYQYDNDRSLCQLMEVMED